jgi:hypothetical protein
MEWRLMREVVKIAVLLVAFVLSVPVLFAAFYELHDFRPYLQNVRDIYDGVAPEDKNPPDQIQDFIWRVEGKTVNGFVAQRLLGEVKHPQRMIGWHYHSVMWTLLLPLHFVKTQRLGFYCHYLPYGGGTGFSRASQFYFGKTPDKPNLDEIASIIAIGRSPGRNSPTRHPEHLQAAKKQLLDAYASVQ